MFGTKKRSGGRVVVVADVESGSAGVAVIQTGTPLKVLALARESLPLEERSQDALRTGVLQQLSAAAEKALAQLSAGPAKKIKISGCYCIVGAPWTHSFAGEAATRFEKDTAITDAMVGELAKQALTAQKDIDRANLLEASVVRVFLNGYPTNEPAGKRARELHILTLASDCDANVKNGAQEALRKVFPGVQLTWRSRARSILSLMRAKRSDGSFLLVEIGAEAADLAIVRKGVLSERASLPLGIRQLALNLAKNKPPEETIALLDMLEKEQCETEACKALETSIAQAEPELAHSFGESLAKLSASRKLSENLVLVAPAQVSPWLSRFFSRIDFTQFTASTKPFSVSELFGDDALSPSEDLRLALDTELSIGCALVNSELVS